MISSFVWASLTDGLVGYWPFDENTMDASGHGYNLSGCVSWAADRSGNASSAAYFNGDSKLSIPTSLYVADSMTVSVWCKPSANITPSLTQSLSYTDGQSMPRSQYVLYPSWGGESSTGKAGVGLLVGQDVVSVIEHADGYCPLPLVWQGNIGSNWTLVTITISNNGGPILYVNGSRIKRGLASSKRKYIGPSIPRSVPDVIGNGEIVGCSSCPYHGLMDDFRIYNRALSASEIKALYFSDVGTIAHSVVFVPNGGAGDEMEDDVFEEGKEQKLPKNTYTKEGYVFQGWAETKADADNGFIKYRDEALITVDHDMTLYAVWAANQMVVHFDANGGVFRDKDGNEVTQFDQCFTYGEAQRLFTDELTPVKMDENGNQFVGWVRGSREYSSPDDYSVFFDKRQEWTCGDDVAEETFYAVWTTTATVTFYNDEMTSGLDRTLTPASLADHLTWSVDGGNARYRSGQPVQVLPGRCVFRVHVDGNYYWIAGRTDLSTHPLYDSSEDAIVMNISNVFDPMFPGEGRVSFDVKVGPPSAEGNVEFLYLNEIRPELRSLIRPEDVPFDPARVRISIGRAYVNESGYVVQMEAYVLSGLELGKFYRLPEDLYYVKDVTYETYTGSGAPYWGAVSVNKQFEVKDDGVTTKCTINFDVFGGADVAGAVFDPRRGECAKSVVWFPYHGSQYSPTGIRVASEVLPTPERAGFRFMGWFTDESGGLEFKEGATIAGDKIHWNLPFDHTFTVYAQWTDMTDKWVNELFPDLVFDQNGNLVTLAKTTAANGNLTVAQCYSCGVDPTDPNDDLKIADFEMKDGKPVITLNHTEDGSGNSFLPRVKTFGKATLSDAEEWREVPEAGDPSMRFFKVGVELP